MADMPLLDDASPETKLAAVEEAILALRRGGSITIGGPDMLAVLAAETAQDAAVQAFERASPCVVLSAARAAAVLGRATTGPVALRPAARRLDAPMLRALADPTLPAAGSQFDVVPLPAGAEVGLALAKLAFLLPAVLVAPAPGRIGLPPAYVLGHAALSASLLVRVSEASVPIADMADCRIITFRPPGSGMEHIAILCGRPEDAEAPLVRVHSECFTGDLLGSLRCDCGAQLRGAIRRIAAEGAGAVLYLAQEGRGIGLPNKLRAYALQDHGLDTVDANRALGFSADERDFHVAATMLHQLGLTRIRLLTNNPDKLASLVDHGITIVAREKLQIAANGVNDGYLQTKARRFGHLLGQ